MAYQPVKSERSFYQNEVRHQWAARLARIHGMEECTELLREFRANHIGPERETYRLYHDSLWIENAIEQRLAQLKAVELSDDDLLERCSSGELAKDVVTQLVAKVETMTDWRDLEFMALECRRKFKPPVMPVNAWLRFERALVTKLMVARGERRARELSIETLRAERGAKLVGDRNMRTHLVTARFEDGETLQFECGEQEDVISAALRDQVILLSQCREGQCTTCKAVCEKGDRQLGDVNVYSLPQEEQDAGFVLLCQTYPRSDLTIDMPYAKEMVSVGARNVHGDLLVRIHTFEKSTPSVHRLVLEHLNPKTKRPRELSYTPGQYLNVGIPGTDEWRSFSMASPPRDDGLLEFFVKEIPGGLFSERFWASAHVGLELSAQGPYGMFHVNRHGQRPRLFVTFGTGIAPVLAMLRSMRQSQDKTPTVLLIVVGDDDRGLCEAEIRELEQSMPGFTVERCAQPVDSRSASRPMERLRELLSTYAFPPDVYLSGADELVLAAETLCREQGVSMRQIYTERFHPTGLKARARESKA